MASQKTVTKAVIYGVDNMIKWFECTFCSEFYATKQPLSVHIGKEHPSLEMQRRLDNHG